MNYEEEYLLLKKNWQEQINLHWRSYIESKTLEITFSKLPEIANFFKNVKWIDGTFETLEESEKSTIIFVLPERTVPIHMVIGNYSYDFSMYLYVDGYSVDLNSFFKENNASSIVWKYLWEFDIFSYIYDLQIIHDNYKAK